MTISLEELSKARIEALRIAKELAYVKWEEAVIVAPRPRDDLQGYFDATNNAVDALHEAEQQYRVAVYAEKERKREIGAAEAKAFMETWGTRGPHP